MSEHLNKDVEKQLNHYMWKCPLSDKETVELRATAESEVEAKRLILQNVRGKEYRELIVDFFSKSWCKPSVNNTPWAGVYRESIPVLL